MTGYPEVTLTGPCVEELPRVAIVGDVVTWQGKLMVYVGGDRRWLDHRYGVWDTTKLRPWKPTKFRPLTHVTDEAAGLPPKMFDQVAAAIKAGSPAAKVTFAPTGAEPDPVPIVVDR